jgi:potassium efflux system protein
MYSKTMTRLRYTITYCLAAFLLISINLPMHTLAQAPESADGDTTSLGKVIEPVALSDIGTETEATLRSIREYFAAVEPSQGELMQDTLLPQKLKEANQLKAKIDIEQIKQMKLRDSENLKNDFLQMRVQLQSWGSGYSEKIEVFEGLKEEIAVWKTRWTKTLDAERDEPLQREVSDLIKSNLKEINRASALISERNNSLLAKQTQLIEALVFIDEVLTAVSKSEVAYKDQILTLDSPPVWNMFGNDDDSTSIGEQFTKVIERHRNEFKSFEENYASNFFWHLLFFSVIVFTAFFLQSDVHKWSDEKRDEAISYSLFVIKRPISAGLLVALLTTSMFYPDAPSSVINYFYLMLIIPIIRLMPALIPSLEKRHFFYFAAVFLISLVSEYFADMVAVERLLLIALNVFVLWIVYNILKQKKDIIQRSSHVNWRFTFSVLRVAGIVLVISLTSNLIGNTILAKILSQGSLTMLFVGIIIYAAALVLRGLLSLLMRQTTISKLNMIQNYEDEVKKYMFRIIRVAAVTYWLYMTMQQFMIFEPLYQLVFDFLSKERKVGTIMISLGSVLAFFITLWIALTASRLVRFILQDEILTHFEMPRGVPGAISMIVRLILITLGFVLAFGAAEIDMSNVAIIFGALGVGIGFGLQNIFNNLVSGLILAFERPIQVGDIIQIASLNLMGEVKDIGIRASVVRTFDGAEVVVPNGNLISNELINWTLSDQRRRQEIIVGVAYGTDINNVLEILNEVISDHENVLKNPAPLIIFAGFGDSSLNFRVLFWTRFDVGLTTKSAVGVAIDEAFKKAGVEIPFPQRDLHLRSVSDSINLLKESSPKSPATGTGRKKATSSKTNSSKE